VKIWSYKFFNSPIKLINIEKVPLIKISTLRSVTVVAFKVAPRKPNKNLSPPNELSFTLKT